MIDDQRMMSAEEMKIREELEKDIERELEEEIKDGIHRLALRLHRLHRQQKERNRAGQSRSRRGKTAAVIITEINITVRLTDGRGTSDIEIKETEKEAPGRRPPPAPACAHVPSYDWTKSRRGPAGIIAVNKKKNGKARKQGSAGANLN